MTFATAITIALIIRTIILFVVGVFLLSAGLIAWHEVIYRKRNGLTTAMRDFCFGVGLTTLMTAVMAFYAAFNGIDSLPFLIMASISIIIGFYTLWACWRLAMKMLEGEPDG